VRTKQRLPLLLVLMLSLVLGMTAAAEPPVKAEEPKLDAAAQKAKQHNEQAKSLFNLGLFDQAAGQYLQAYHAKPVPAFLFNLAQCYKRMSRVDQLTKSIFYFESFLKNSPYSPMSAEIEKEVVRLKVRIKELKRPAPFYKRWWFWTAVGVAVAGAAVGTAFALQPDDEQPADVTIGTFEVP
jgi:tetratricopeptide (TPR) repeat protein